MSGKACSKCEKNNPNLRERPPLLASSTHHRIPSLSTRLSVQPYFNSPSSSKDAQFSTSLLHSPVASLTHKRPLASFSAFFRRVYLVKPFSSWMWFYLLKKKKARGVLTVLRLLWKLPANDLQYFYSRYAFPNLYFGCFPTLFWRGGFKKAASYSTTALVNVPPSNQ